MARRRSLDRFAPQPSSAKFVRLQRLRASFRASPRLRKTAPLGTVTFMPGCPVMIWAEHCSPSKTDAWATEPAKRARHGVFPSIATGNDRGAEWFIRWPRARTAHACALPSTWIAGFRDINEQSEGRRRWLLRLWAECPRRIPLCALHLGLSQLTCILLVGKLLVLWACE
jgi:hypothetical protein